jgi:hypothetical protein
MVGIDASWHALCHPYKSTFLGSSQKAALNARRLPELGTLGLSQSLGINLFREICH